MEAGRERYLPVGTVYQLFCVGHYYHQHTSFAGRQCFQSCHGFASNSVTKVLIVHHTNGSLLNFCDFHTSRWQSRRSLLRFGPIFSGFHGGLFSEKLVKHVTNPPPPQFTHSILVSYCERVIILI